MSAFTPGPWEIDGTGQIVRTATGVNERGGMTGGLFVAQFFGGGLPSEHDARLIAAAPDMHDALRECQAVLAMFTAPDAIRQSTVASAYAAAVAAEAKARAALNKATGRSVAA